MFVFNFHFPLFTESNEKADAWGDASSASAAFLYYLLRNLLDTSHDVLIDEKCEQLATVYVNDEPKGDLKQKSIGTRDYNVCYSYVGYPSSTPCQMKATENWTSKVALCRIYCDESSDGVPLNFCQT